MLSSRRFGEAGAPTGVHQLNQPRRNIVAGTPTTWTLFDARKAKQTLAMMSVAQPWNGPSKRDRVQRTHGRHACVSRIRTV